MGIVRHNSTNVGGNLIFVKEYAYTRKNQAPQEPPVKTETGTYGTAWKDQLMSWNGTAMSYDAIGNMLTKGDISYSWTLGRKLSGVNNGKNIRYEYDHTGARIRKTVDNNVTEYRLAGDLLVAEVTNGKETSFVYDSGADLVAMIYEGKYYFYVKNLQGDIVSIVDESGTAIVNYSYDSWGRLLQIEGSKKDTIGILNPFRYRGYYYDTETGMYYLKNRYYDPEIRRFICADETGTICMLLETVHNKNLYLYCNANPIVRRDENGEIWEDLIFGAAEGAVFSIASQVVNGEEINWKNVGMDAVSGAISSVLSGKVQIVWGIVTSAYQSYRNDESGFEVIWAGVTGGLSNITLLEGNFIKHFKEYKMGRNIIADLRISSEVRNEGVRMLNRAYARETAKDVVKSGTNQVVTSQMANLKCPSKQLDYAPFIPVDSPYYVPMPKKKRELVDMIPIKKKR